MSEIERGAARQTVGVSERQAYRLLAPVPGERRVCAGAQGSRPHVEFVALRGYLHEHGELFDYSDRLWKSAGEATFFPTASSARTGALATPPSSRTSASTI